MLQPSHWHSGEHNLFKMLFDATAKNLFFIEHHEKCYISDIDDEVIVIPVTFVVVGFISGIIESVNMLCNHKNCLKVCVNKQE